MVVSNRSMQSQKRIEETLNKSIDTCLEGCQIIGFDWRYLYVNKTVAKQGRKQKKELLGRTMMEAYPGIEKTSFFKVLRHCMEKRIFSTRENEFRFSDGRKGWFELLIEPVPDGILIFSLDITKRKKTEAKLKEMDKEKSEFVSVASHALRTPLGISKWYLEVLRKESFLKNAPSTTKEYIAEIIKNNERLLSLVRNLLSVSRIDEGKMQDTPQFIDVHLLLQEVINALKVLTIKQKITINLVYTQPREPQVFIDSLKLQEVIENLVTNAIKYNKPKGSVIITSVQEKKRLRLSVTDTGIGIAPEDQKKIFDKFFRSEQAIISNTEGSGLGLYVVKSYVNMWGGKVTLQSEEGKGTTIILEIPIKVREGR